MNAAATASNLTGCRLNQFCISCLVASLSHNTENDTLERVVTADLAYCSKQQRPPTAPTLCAARKPPIISLFAPEFYAISPTTSIQWWPLWESNPHVHCTRDFKSLPSTNSGKRPAAFSYTAARLMSALIHTELFNLLRRRLRRAFCALMEVVRLPERLLRAATGRR